MRILYLTQYFPPEMGAPQARIPELMGQMIALGHHVTILTAMPNYPTGRVFPEYRGRLTARESYQGMEVVRTWIDPTLSLGFVRRTVSQMSFAISSALCGPFLTRRHDVMLVESPPLVLALTALWLKRLLRTPYVAVVADLWPDVAIDTGMLRSTTAIGVAKWMEKALYRGSLAVITQTPGQADVIRVRCPGTRALVVSGGVDAVKFSPELRSEEVRREFDVEGRIGVVFSGLHGFAQGLDVVIDAAVRLRDRPDVRFVMIGDGAVKADLVRRARTLGLTNVTFHNPIPRVRMPSILASMDIALAPLRQGVPKATIPTKMYEAMASGLPVVTAAEGEASDLIRNAAVGEAVAPGAADDFAAAVLRLADDPTGRRECGERALLLVRERFDRKRIAAGLHAFLMDVVAERRRAPTRGRPS
jgi:glycosyltransferase involved in cell wall biosynthesis